MKIFRAIRLDLLGKNRIGRYVLYAVGEIILVVVGILIALHINEWNQGRLDNRMEVLHLENLIEELKGNSDFNKAMMSDRMEQKLSSLELAKQFCEGRIQVKDTLKFLNTVTFGGVFSGGADFGVRNFYDELLSTGNLQLIQNDSIKKVLSTYYTRMEVYESRSLVHAGRFSNYTSSLRPYIPENPDNISEYDQREMMRAFTSREFRRLVDLEIAYAYKMRDYLAIIDSQAYKAIELIEKELDQRSRE